MRRLGWILALGFLLSTGCGKPQEKPGYYLGLVNGTGAPVKVTVSLDGGTHEVKPDSAISVRVKDQDPAQDGAEREFRIEGGGKVQVVKGKVKYADYPVLDVGGQSCYAVVDYYKAYTEGGLSVSPDVLEVKALVRGQRFASLELPSLAAGLGDPLPEKVYKRSDLPDFQVVRVVAFPCDLAEDEAGLKAWLASH